MPVMVSPNKIWTKFHHSAFVRIQAVSVMSSSTAVTIPSRDAMVRDLVVGPVTGSNEKITWVLA